MESIHRLFLIIEGENTAYPNYSDAKLHLTAEEPSSLKFDNIYISSPIFSILENGAKSIPNLNDGSIVTFIMMPRVFPDMFELTREFKITNEVWFSLGLANLVVIEKSSSISLGESIIHFLSSKGNITASETWQIENSRIQKHVLPNSLIDHESKVVEQVDIPISVKLPFHIKFAVTEFKSFTSKLLTASKKFTPEYFEIHKKTVLTSSQLIYDLSFLHEDFEFDPDTSILTALGSRNKEEAILAMSNPDLNKKREELINDRNGRLIQFNSSLSYVFSQTFSGTFPLFDHTGIIQRHSLLGVGSAVSSLTQLINQIEGALFFLPYEDLTISHYSTSFIPSIDYYESFQDLSFHDSNKWHRDLTRAAVIKSSKPDKNKVSKPEDFFNRLAFFSGRLGFREYDFSATAAIQVLVESNSLQWNVINYTHEIIHNHVRIILNQMIIPSMSIRKEDYDIWIRNQISLLSSIFHSIKRNEVPGNLTYFQYFVSILIKYCVNSRTYGSLSRPSNYELINKLRGDATKKEKYKLPTQLELTESILNLYKDLTEIFVHVIDFCYIYSRDRDTYLESIWSSWSTVSSVSNDIKQYIVRTLIIIGLTETGTLSYRYNTSRTIFLSNLDKIATKNRNSYLFSRIRAILEDENDKDIKPRFSNSLVIADLVFNFFVGDIESYLDNEDDNRLSKVDKSDDDMRENEPYIYAIERNSFEGNNIKSKVRFALDQLIRETNQSTILDDDAKKERTSAWLLLSLSSLEHL